VSGNEGPLGVDVRAVFGALTHVFLANPGYEMRRVDWREARAARVWEVVDV